MMFSNLFRYRALSSNSSFLVTVHLLNELYYTLGHDSSTLVWKLFDVVYKWHILSVILINRHHRDCGALCISSL